MKFVFFFLPLCIPCIANAQQDGYSLDAWFWHRHLSTQDSIFTQDYDNEEHKISVPVHLSEKDFKDLDSVADLVGLWAMPDTIGTGQSEKSLESIITGKWQSSFYFRTPRHPHPKAIASRMVAGSAKLYEWESTILEVMDRQEYYNTLPKPMERN